MTEDKKDQQPNLRIINYPGKKDQYYKTINLTALLDKRLSFKAKGLHTYIMTRPDNWHLYTLDLFSKSTDGESSVRTAMKELIDLGYLHRFAVRDKGNRRILYWSYVSCSEPIKREELDSDFLHQENLHQENLHLENPAHSNNKDSNKNDSYKKEAIINDSIGGSKTAKQNFPVKEKYAAEKLIKFWSNLGYTINHAKYPDTKVCQSIIRKIVYLQKGTFKKIGSFDPVWITKNKIPEAWFTKHWTYQELLEGLKEASKYCLDGYWPPDNKDFYRSLDNILYYTGYQQKKQMPGKSYLFAAINNPPVSDKQKFWKNPVPIPTKTVMQHPIWPVGYDFDERKLATGLLELKDFSKKLIPDPYNKTIQYFGDLPKLLNEYLGWLEHQQWLTDINENLFGTDNKVFRRFIEDQEKEIGIKIRSKGWK